MMKNALKYYYSSWWLPAFLFVCILVGFTITAISRWQALAVAAYPLFYMAGIAFLGLISASIWNLVKKRWRIGLINALLILGCGMATVYSFGFLMSSMFGPSEDNFADLLTIPEDLEISEPDLDSGGSLDVNITRKFDEFQDMIRNALAVRGGEVTEFAPSMPSLRMAATDHAETFRNYLEASPDWHVFVEQRNRFAARRWSYEGAPRDPLHGYISDFSSDDRFQTRCLICLDRKQWSRYSVQHVEEGPKPVKPEMSRGNQLHESRVMIECGGVWVEIFEQSTQPERRVTKATITALEKEFSEFSNQPERAVSRGSGSISRVGDPSRWQRSPVLPTRYGYATGNLRYRLFSQSG